MARQEVVRAARRPVPGGFGGFWLTLAAGSGLPPPGQFLLKVEARHTRHHDVEEEAAGRKSSEVL